MSNIDTEEVAKFAALAEHWWDPEGDMQPLHEINPLRLRYVDERAPLAGKRVLDVGCGGGILAEGMAAAGAEVTGIDLAEEALEAARAHLQQSGLEVEYHCTTAEDMARRHPGEFDAVTCMEMLEHVPSPASVVRACSELVNEEGTVFFSTLNRNPKSFLLAIIGAEYVLNMLPRGTHDYSKFIRPSELAEWARAAGLKVEDVTGLTYNPLFKSYHLGSDVDVNYFMTCRHEF